MSIKKSTISLKRLLITSITLLIVSTGISITIVSYWSNKTLGYSMASNIMADNSSRILVKVENYLNSASLVNRSITHLISSGEIDIDDTFNRGVIFNHFRHYLDLYPGFVGVYYGDEKGRFLYGKRMPDNSISFRVINQVDNKIYSSWFHDSETWSNRGFSNSIDGSEQGYDPRRRTWYIKAIDTGFNVWSDVYTFSSDKKPGITNSQPVRDIKGNIKGVLGIDIGLIDISYYLSSLDLSNKGEIIVLNRKNEIIASSMNGEEDELLVKKSYEQYLEYKDSKKLKAFRFNGTKYVTAYEDFSIDGAINWKVGILLPEESVLGIVHKSVTLIIVIAVIFIILATLIGLRLSYNISEPLMLISKDMKRICRLDLDGDVVISTDLEELQEIDKSFLNLKKGMRSFSKYVPSRLVARLITMGREAVLGGERRNLTVLFTDITDFTKISENMEPEYLVEELADYLGTLSKIIHSNNGTVDKFIGDSIMAFWNAPDDVENHAALACKTAIEIQQYLSGYKKDNPHRTHFPTRIGINTGEVLVGNIGSEDRMNYTVMGDNINLGSRLEQLNRDFGTSILISRKTMKDAGTGFKTRLVDDVKIKGRSREITVYELLAADKSEYEFEYINFNSIPVSKDLV